MLNTVDIVRHHKQANFLISCVLQNLNYLLPLSLRLLNCPNVTITGILLVTPPSATTLTSSTMLEFTGWCLRFFVKTPTQAGDPLHHPQGHLYQVK